MKEYVKLDITKWQGKGYTAVILSGQSTGAPSCEVYSFPAILIRAEGTPLMG